MSRTIWPARVGVLGVGLLAVAVLATGTATASCALDQRPLEEQVAAASVVFVGTVVDVRHGTTAKIEVDEVWVGDVPDQVVVRGGPDEPGMATSVDRSWEVGTRYLVVPRVDGGDLVDDSCSPTRPWTEDLAEARPASAHEPTPLERDGGTRPWLPVAIAVVLVGAVVASALLVRPWGGTQDPPGT